MPSAHRFRFVVLACLLINGCGGGGGGSGPPATSAPAISYGSSRFTASAGTPLTLTPSNSGGAATSWSISAGLPAGLAFNSANGVISGTLSDAAAPSSFTVTASNAGGSDSVTLAIGAQAALVSLGALNVGAIALSNADVLTEDGGGTQHWVLWNYASGSIIAQGDSCPVGKCLFGDVGAMLDVGVAGPIAVVPYTASAIQILSAQTGSVLSTIQGNFLRFQVAPDGSYVCTVDATALTAWGPDGKAIVSHPGDYRNALVSCVPGEMRIGNGPAGVSVIQSISLASGNVAVSPPFAGTFVSWFADGGGFVTSAGTTVWVYSPTAALLDTRTLGTAASLGATGQWFWTFDGTTLNIYQIGASATPTATYTVNTNQFGTSIQAWDHTLALWDNEVHIIDLTSPTPVKVDYATPIGGLYAAVSPTQWVVGSSQGAVVDGVTLNNPRPRFFGYGAALSLFGTQTRLGLATASGQTLIYDTADWSLVANLYTGIFAQIELSSDGSVLAGLTAHMYGSLDTTVKTISLPSGNVINTWTYNWDSGPAATSIVLSQSGQLLGQVISGFSLTPPSRQVTAATGGPDLWSDSGSIYPLFLSPDGTLIAAGVPGSGGVATTTNIYLNYTLATSLPGLPLTWLSNSEILQNTGNGSVVYQTSGVPLSGPMLPTLVGPVQPLSSGGAVFDAATDAIYSISTGMQTWSSQGYNGTVADDRVASVFGNQIATEPF